ncbi:MULTISPECIES: hypothetical protein [Methanohalophilus]|uniref:Uncharacterized protein n=2 Tax=Methanohalophilus portucalensis TaxID=39664 RepID=A0A1X7MW38_9EURY|nr:MULTISPECIES: hypothetical protein [Methanohalophilus]ATU08867.1 hypothetical protein BKM01_08865 [Methanohalophilus portucalensis]RNI11284.1 hypothetical protein EFE41_06950 [Methanohalophilus portucalensis FDF-1]SMH28585.1 hypothetical protein SAMN06264941_0058 [Methanohalophilus portucalensis FDF-1]
MTKMGRYIPFIIFCFIVLWIFYGYFVVSKYYVDMILLSFAALFSSIGMYKTEYGGVCKYLVVLFISAVIIGSYVTSGNYYALILGITFLLLAVVDYIKTLK